MRKNGQSKITVEKRSVQFVTHGSQQRIGDWYSDARTFSPFLSCSKPTEVSCNVQLDHCHLFTTYLVLLD